MTSVADIMRCCARAYGVMLVGHISSQTVGQAIEEGGLAAKMQVGEIVHQLDGESTYHFVRIPILRLGTYEPLGIMLSMDGTKECNINYEGMHIMANQVSSNGTVTHKQLTLGVHTLQARFRWMSLRSI